MQREEFGRGASDTSTYFGGREVASTSGGWEGALLSQVDSRLRPPMFSSQAFIWFAIPCICVI